MNFVRIIQPNIFQRFFRKFFSVINLRLSIIIISLIPRSKNIFLELNRLNANILYYLIIKKDFAKFKYYVKQKFEKYEYNIFNDFLNDIDSIEKLTKCPEIKVLGPVNKSFSFKENVYYIILKKNKLIKPSNSIIFPNHIYSEKESFDDYKMVVNFFDKEKKINDLKNIKVPYPIGTNNIASPMALQRVLFFLKKYVNYNSVKISGFNMYAGSFYDRNFYPTLINKSNEIIEIALSLSNHGIIFNWMIVNYFHKFFSYDNELNELSKNQDFYLKNLYSSFWS